MTKKILFITGGVIVVLLIGAWVYLLLFGTPLSSDGLFARFDGVTPTTEREEITNQDTETRLAIDNQLQQLTTKAVAGYGFVSLAATTTENLAISDKQYLRYAERGTGHVFEIDLTSGIEKRVSNQTFPQVTQATFSPDGNQVVLQSETEAPKLLTISNGTTTELPDTATNFHWRSTTNLAYTTTSENSTTYYQNKDGVVESKWSTLFTEVLVYPFGDGEIIVNKVAPHLKGGIFAWDDGKLNILVPPQYGLFALPQINSETLSYSYYDPTAGRFQHQHLEIATNQSQTSPLALVPEKCSPSATASSTVYCAVSEDFLYTQGETLNDWYKGKLVVADDLWVIEDQTAASLLTPLSSVVGFTVDVIDLQATAEYLFFRNRVNDTLWMYRLGK